MWSVLSGTPKALPKVSDRVELLSIFLVLYSLCSVKVFNFGNPMEMCLSLDFCIALPTNRTQTFMNILGDRQGEILSQK